MAIRKNLKDSENYQLVAGLDENKEAQELTFNEDRVKVSIGDALYDGSIMGKIYAAYLDNNQTLELIFNELRIMNVHLSSITDISIKEID